MLFYDRFHNKNKVKIRDFADLSKNNIRPIANNLVTGSYLEGLDYNIFMSPARFFPTLSRTFKNVFSVCAVLSDKGCIEILSIFKKSINPCQF